MCRFVSVMQVYENDALNQQISCQIDVKMTYQTANILIIYTGGTIGMKNTQNAGYVPLPGYLCKILSVMRRFHDPTGLGLSNLEADGVIETKEKFESTVNVPISYDRSPGPFAQTDALKENIEQVKGIDCVKQVLPVRWRLLAVNISLRSRP